MKELTIKPDLYTFETVKEFAEEFKLGKGDLVMTSRHIYEPFLKGLHLECDFICHGDYGKGEPSDELVEAMAKDIDGSHKRIIAIGGGSILDVAKLFALKQVTPVLDLYDNIIPPVKNKTLILVPTTCGTGSEVTNISILALNSRGTKKGLAVPELFPDGAVLIPELLSVLPFSVFATSSIDALVHAVESSLSPKANETTRMFGYQAIDMILRGYMEIRKNGPEARIPLLPQFLKASAYAGIAFGNAGCGAVHAMSYPLGATYHVPHGESNYAMFTGVLKAYMSIRSDGEIAVLNQYMADILGCETDRVYDELESLLNVLLTKKPLHEYGMKEKEVEEFADSVMANQQRLLGNNFVPLDREQLVEIYRALY